MTTAITPGSYPHEPAIRAGELPDPFLKSNGDRVAEKGEWNERGKEWAKQISVVEYGGLPPRPDRVRVEVLCETAVHDWPGEPKLNSYRIHCDGGAAPFSFCVQILLPRSDQPVPAIVNGDGCWWYATDEVARRVVERGCAFVLFNRTEIVDDLQPAPVSERSKRTGGLYGVYPGMEFGALSAWAWGYHRCVDLLERLPFIDASRIAASGHSRGGKTVLLAGATDERIALVNDNASGEGGAGAYRFVGHGGETIDIISAFPAWFGSGLKPFVGREGEIPFDQHCLLASIAPRPLLLTYALDDRWSNPEGVVQCAWAANEVYRFLGEPENLAFHFRQGDHAHALEDWEVLLDFIGWKWQGKQPRAIYNAQPYGHLLPVFGWKAPQT